MLRVVRPFSKRPHIDLETVRETLVYMESDCRSCPALEGVAAALNRTINEIDRVQATKGNDLPTVPPVLGVRFIPAES